MLNTAKTIILRPQKQAKIVIVDYGMGNLGSIKNMFSEVGIESVVTSSAEKIEKAEKLILPGVGAFDEGMTKLKKLGLIPVLNDLVFKKKIPILGICLGMQLMSQKSEEGKLPGLGWVKAETIKFDFGENKKNLKIPHMGWNTVTFAKKNPLNADLPRNCQFYFVHSYHVVCKDKKDVLFKTNYGFPFTSAFSHQNVFGVQFHPEKSHKFGMQLLKNFGSTN
jgi:glutamine amidotransferase